MSFDACVGHFSAIRKCPHKTKPLLHTRPHSHSSIRTTASPPTPFHVQEVFGTTYETLCESTSGTTCVTQPLSTAALSPRQCCCFHSCARSSIPCFWNQFICKCRNPCREAGPRRNWSHHQEPRDVGRKQMQKNENPETRKTSHAAPRCTSQLVCRDLTLSHRR